MVVALGVDNVFVASIFDVVVVDPKNLPLKFGSIFFRNSRNIVVVVIIVIVVVDPRSLPLEFGQNRVSIS